MAHSFQILQIYCDAIDLKYFFIIFILKINLKRLMKRKCQQKYRSWIHSFGLGKKFCLSKLLQRSFSQLMIACKESSNLRQYMLAKPNKWGFNVALNSTKTFPNHKDHKTFLYFRKISQPRNGKMSTQE